MNQGLFLSRKPIIGMVHLLPLPGSPGYAGDLFPIIRRAKEDAQRLVDAGFDGMIVENFADKPYTTGPGPLERTVAYTIVLTEIRRMVDLPLGVNVQFNDYQAELITAGLCAADFIRVEAFVDSLTSAGGISPACAADLQRMKVRLGFNTLKIFADVHVKEAFLIGNASITESVRSAEQAGADAIIITGTATGQATPIDPILEAKKSTQLKILVGSGFDQANAVELMSVADGAIVGSSIKVGGVADNPVDPKAARRLITAVRGEL